MLLALVYKEERWCWLVIDMGDIDSEIVVNIICKCSIPHLNKNMKYKF